MEMDNDVIWNRDSGFTNGWSIQYYTPCAASWEETSTLDSIKWVGKHFPTLDDQDAVVRLSHGIGQNMITPGDLEVQVPEDGDLPYAGTFTYTLGWQAFNRCKASIFQISMGILGSEALAEPLQKMIHENLGVATPPNGWDTQRKTEPILNIGYQYAYCLASIGQYNDDWASQIFMAPNVLVGNLFTAAELAFVLRVGWNMPEGFNTYAAPPGQGFFQATYLPKSILSSPHSVEFIIGCRATALAYSVIYDGSLITNDDRDVERKHYFLSAGVGIYYHYYDHFAIRATLQSSTDLLDSKALPPPKTAGKDKTDSEISFGSLIIDWYF